MENIFYYIGLYLVVILVKLAEFVKKTNTEEYKNKWTEILDVSLDLTFAASGCIIALLLNVEKTWIPVVYILSTIILLCSSFMKFLSDRLKSFRPWLNGLIIVTIFSGTIFLFKNIIPHVDNNGNIIDQKEKNKNSIYTVILPYKDESLISNVGYNKIGDRSFLYKIDVNSNSKDSAKIIAINRFNQESNIKPVYKLNLKNKKDLISISDAEILVLGNEN
jgi:hypothetical protein